MAANATANATSHEELIAAFETRWDYASARVMVTEVLAAAEVNKQAAYDGAALSLLEQALAAYGADGAAIVARLSAATTSAAPAATEAAVKAPTAAKPAAKAAAKPAAKAAAKSAAKPAAKSAAKSAAKPAAKKG